MVIWKWGSTPGSASKRCIQSSFIPFIQPRLEKSLTLIIQTESTKQMCKSTTISRGSDKNLFPCHFHRRLPGNIQRKRLVWKLPRSPSPPFCTNPSLGC
jgi:hypothetical protein